MTHISKCDKKNYTKENNKKYEERCVHKIYHKKRCLSNVIALESREKKEGNMTILSTILNASRHVRTQKSNQNILCKKSSVLFIIYIVRLILIRRLNNSICKRLSIT